MWLELLYFILYNFIKHTITHVYMYADTEKPSFQLVTDYV